jgi:phosphoglycerate dehydrogenase-like enzyme/glyoxylase-like metal-dependent hydrolase (beta-lactamase superfamily II)
MKHFWLAFFAVAGLAPLLQAGGPLAPMKFNDVREIAPGVFFRYSSISATDKTIPFGGSNNIWVVFKDYVVVYDANFPKEAGDVIAAIKKTTDKPIRYVIDSHHHGDHAYGNAVWAKAGATILSSANTARILRASGPADFEKEGKGPGGRKDVAASTLRVPDLFFDEKLVLDDDTQRVEFHFLGHAHTAGDSVMYLPKHKILCTGDACVNGAFNFMGHSDSASWIRVLDKMQQFDVKIVCPGHGMIAGPDLLKTQQRYFIDLRAQVRKALDEGKDFDEVVASMNMPWQKEWTGLDIKERKDNIRHVFDEFTGRVAPWDLFEDFGLYEGPSPTKASPGWKAPKRIVVPDLMPARLLELKRIAPDVLFVPVRNAAEAAKEAADADAVVGFASADIATKGKNLRWIQVASAGVEKDLVPEVVKSPATLTNTARVYGPNVADQAFTLVLALNRGMAPQLRKGQPQAAVWETLKKQPVAQELRGKSMLLVGLGGVGTEIARRADAFGMKVMALDPNEKIVRPSFVFSLDRPARLMDMLPTADVVVLACPLTAETKESFAASQFHAMKKSAQFINIGRGGLVKQSDLVAALKSGVIAGAGMDVTDPEPLPDSHPLWSLSNVVITPHLGGQSDGARDRQWRLFRENIRRFVAGEPLLCVVDKQRGY